MRPLRPCEFRSVRGKTRESVSRYALTNSPESKTSITLTRRTPSGAIRACRARANSRVVRWNGIENALNALPERERQVTELRFGLTGGQPCTLEEVGKAFGVTRERIRQIENNTLKKLEGLPEAQALRDCV